MKTNFFFRMLFVVVVLVIGKVYTKAANNVIWNTVTEMSQGVSIKLPYGTFDNVQEGDYLYITCNRTNQSNSWWSYSMYYGYNQPFYAASKDDNSNVYDGSIIKITITDDIREKLQYKQMDWKNDVDEENSRIIVYGENITIREISIVTKGGSTVTTYKLTFMLDNEVFDVQYLQAGEVIKEKTPSYKSGYTFDGWTNLPKLMPAKDLIIYGYYSKNSQYVTLSVGSTSYSTYCAMTPLRFLGTEDVKAYIVKAKSDTQVVLSQVVGAVAAGTGLVLKGWAANRSDQFEVVETGTIYNYNLLVGVSSDKKINSPDLYVLVEKDGVVKFADTGYNAAVVPAGKAYLQAPSSGSRILSITFEDDETTGITILPSITEVQSSSYYNLGGQRVANPAKGLYIVNGKKAVFK